MTCVTMYMCRLKSLSNRCATCATPQTGTDSAASPLGVVRIRGCATLCHPVPPCATRATLLTGVEEKEVLTQGGTGWHRVAHSGDPYHSQR